MKFTQKVTISLCWRASPALVAAHRSSHQITLKIGWLDLRGSIRDVSLGGWWGWTGGKRLQLKIVVEH